MNKVRALKGRLNWYQVQLAVFILFVVVGSIYTNINLVNNTEQYNLLINSLIEKINETDITKVGLFKYVLINRMKAFIIIWLIGFIAFAKQINLLITSYLGISVGVLLSISIISKGLDLYLLVLLLHIPHYIVYVPVYIYLIFNNTKFSDYLYEGKRTFRRSKLNPQVVFEYILVLVITILLVVIGVFLESFINVDIISWYANIINK